MRNTLKKISLVVLSCTLVLLLVACKKENSWSTRVANVTALNYNSATLKVEFEMPRNHDYLYAGLSVSILPNPTYADIISQDQYIKSDTKEFELINLLAETTYHARSFIETKGGEYIYSEDFAFTTSSIPNPPCTLTSGVFNISGNNENVTDLNLNTVSGNYKLSTSCSLGTIDFIFGAEPISGLYTTVNSPSYLSNTEINISGIIGSGMTCFYGGSSVGGIYVDNNGSGTITLQFCDLVMSTSQSCPDTYTIAGEVHN